MLYVTTRNTNDAYTAYRALVNDKGSDGGYFAPFRLPVYDKEALLGLKDKSCNQIVSEILNTFFSLGLDSFDLDLSIGKNLVRLNTISRRIVVAELWHNLGGHLSYLEDALLKKLAKNANSDISKEWAAIAVKIAVTFAIYGHMLHTGVIIPDETLDFSVRDDAFSVIMALWYCRQMGLPINTLICTCDENGILWDFINRGTLPTTNTDNKLCAGVERLLHAVLGCSAVKDFCTAIENKQIFSLTEEAICEFKKGFFCSVAGKDRAKSVINSVYRTNEYIIDHKTALCYGGLQDYRAKFGGSNLTVLLAESTPIEHIDLIAEATGLDLNKIKNLIK